MTPAELQDLRLSLGWSQETAAQRLGVARRTYYYYEEGRTHRGKTLEQIPRPVAIAALAQRFLAEVMGELGLPSDLRAEWLGNEEEEETQP